MEDKLQGAGTHSIGLEAARLNHRGPVILPPATPRDEECGGTDLGFSYLILSSKDEGTFEQGMSHHLTLSAVPF